MVPGKKNPVEPRSAETKGKHSTAGKKRKRDSSVIAEGHRSALRSRKNQKKTRDISTLKKDDGAAPSQQNIWGVTTNQMGRTNMGNISVPIKILCREYNPKERGNRGTENADSAQRGKRKTKLSMVYATVRTEANLGNTEKMNFQFRKKGEGGLKALKRSQQKTKRKERVPLFGQEESRRNWERRTSGQACPLIILSRPSARTPIRKSPALRKKIQRHWIDRSNWEMSWRSSGRKKMRRDRRGRGVSFWKRPHIQGGEWVARGTKNSSVSEGGLTQKRRRVIYLWGSNCRSGGEAIPPQWAISREGLSRGAVKSADLGLGSLGGTI